MWLFCRAYAAYFVLANQESHKVEVTRLKQLIAASECAGNSDASTVRCVLPETLRWKIDVCILLVGFLRSFR